MNESIEQRPGVRVGGGARGSTEELRGMKRLPPLPRAPSDSDPRPSSAAEPDIPVPPLARGLTDQEAERSRERYGSNAVVPGKRPGFLRSFLSSLNDPIIRILLFALAVNTVFSFSGTGWAESAGIALTVLVSALVSTLSERSSGASFEKLYAALGDSRCRVLRDGTEKAVSAGELVRHDLVLLKPGDTVPADGILLSGDLSCDESPLTGESRPVRKSHASPEPDREPRPGDPHSLLRGNHVTEGGGIMLVTAVGSSTLYGQIAGELEAEDGVSPLKNRLSALARSISRMGYVSAGIVAAVYLADSFWFDAGQNAAVALMRLTDPSFVLRELSHALTLAISILVVAVPEGLPMMITVVLAANMKKMMKHGVLVRRLVGIETAGSVDLLFTDKTGTLTTGRLTVESVLTVGNPSADPASRSLPDPPGHIRPFRKRKEESPEKARPRSIRMPDGTVFTSSPGIGSCPAAIALHLRESASVCASSGNQTEKALAVFSRRPSAVPVLSAKRERIPFDSSRKFAAGVSGNRILVTPGMVELGDMEAEMNRNLGRAAAGCCDTAILVGKKRSEAIASGLLENGFRKENIIVANSLEEAAELLKARVKPGDTVLFENDLPDNYTEG